MSVQKFKFISGNEKVIELLLKNGANASIVDNEKRTPVHLAVTHCKFQNLSLNVVRAQNNCWVFFFIQVSRKQ